MSDSATQLKRVSIAIVGGFGAVGKEVARQLAARRSHYASNHQLDVRLIAVCGSKSGIADVEGINEVYSAQAILGQTGVEWLSKLRPDIVIDATPTDFRTGGAGLAYAGPLLSAGCDLIAISKKTPGLDKRISYARIMAMRADALTAQQKWAQARQSLDVSIKISPLDRRLFAKRLELDKKLKDRNAQTADEAKIKSLDANY